MINATTFGDLAQSFSLQRRGVALKVEMDRLNQELVTGQVSDVKAILAGNVSYLTDIENRTRLLDSYRLAGTEAALFTDAMQNALGRIQDVSTAYGQEVAAMSNNAVTPVLDQFAADAEAQLQTVLSALNTSVAGRSIFSGAASDQAAMVDTQTILTALQTVVSGAGDAAAVRSAADAWFADPSGFLATAYTGSSNALVPFRLAENETVSVPYTAARSELTEIVKGLALSALADDGIVTSIEEQRKLMTATGVDLISAQAGVTALRADVGASQERIDQLTTRSSAERLSLDYAKGALLGADPYETATKLEEVQFQLQSLYTVTARMSDLSLVNFIR